jgi:hypothetical protein
MHSESMLLRLGDADDSAVLCGRFGINIQTFRHHCSDVSATMVEICL